MSYKFIFAMTLVFMSLGQLSHADDIRQFYGYGSCRIQSPECAGGTFLSCSTAGPSGGYCLWDEDRDYYRVECKAFSYGGSSVNSRFCVKANR